MSAEQTCRSYLSKKVTECSDLSFPLREWNIKQITYKWAWRFVAESQCVDDLFVVVETGFSLQNVETFNEVHSEGFSQKKSLRKVLEGLPVWDGSCYVLLSGKLQLI